MITYIILGITIFISITAMDNHSLKNKMMFNAYMIKERKEWYRFFSAGLIHADYPHLIFNMYSLYLFGINFRGGVEGAYEEMFEEKGMLFYIFLYVSALAMSSLYSYEKHKQNVYYNALGASGAISAVIFAFILIHPKEELGLLFLPFFVPGYVFGAIYLGFTYYLAKRGRDNIGHDAHFWGAVYGIVFTIILKPSVASQFISQITGR